MPFGNTMKTNTKQKSKLKGFVCLCLVIAILISCAYAYMTSTDNKVNHFNIGTLNVELVGGSYLYGEDIVPGVIVGKEPKIQNNGTNDSYVVMEINIPLLNCDYLVRTENGYETVEGSDNTEVYEMRNANGETVTEKTKLNDGWVFLGKKAGSASEKTASKYYFGFTRRLNGATGGKKDVTNAPISYLRMTNFSFHDDNSGTVESPFLNLHATVSFVAYGIQADGLISDDINAAFSTLSEIHGLTVD